VCLDPEGRRVCTTRSSLRFEVSLPTAKVFRFDPAALRAAAGAIRVLT
jgi:hypothetical protein